MKKTTMSLVVLLAAVSYVGAQAQFCCPSSSQAVLKLDPALDAIVSPDAKLELVRDGFGITEGASWVPTGKTGYLVFTDLAANVIYKMTPDRQFSVLVDRAGYTGYDPWNVGLDNNNGRDEKDPLYRKYFLVGADGLAVDKDGRIAVASWIGRSVYRLEKDGKRTLLADRYEGKRLAGPNDVCYKKDGSLYFTETRASVGGRGHDRNEELPPPGIYRIKDGKLTLVVTDNPTPNGLAFSPDEKYLYTTAAMRTLRRYEVQPDGSMANGRLFIDMNADPARGGPDGVRTDSQGNVWTTGPGGVWIISPEGKHLGTILDNTEFDNGANFGFGDPDYKTVYFTSRGRLLKMRVNVTGYHPF